MPDFRPHEQSTPSDSPVQQMGSVRLMRYLFVLVAFVAGLQLIQDLSGLQFFEQVGREVGKVLAVASDIPQAKLTGINDNYHRCQNKLGIQSTINIDGISEVLDVYDGQNTAVEAGLERDMQNMYASGMQYVLFTVNLPDGGRVEQVAKNMGEVLKLAKRNHLKPIISVGDSSDSAFIGNPGLLLTFYDKTVEGSGDNVEFVATTAPRALINEGLYPETVDYAERVAGALRAQKNIITAPPILRNVNVGGACPIEGFCQDHEGFNIYSEVGALRFFELNLVNFDTALIGLQNYDINFRSPTRESFYEHSAYYQYAEVEYGGKSWIEEYNTNLQANIRAIIVDFAPGQGTFQGNAALLNERLGFDFGRLSDDPTIAGVVMGSEMLNLAQLDSDFYQKLNLYGTNCNYDIVDYEQEYTAQSTAPVCSTEFVKDNVDEDRARTKIVCDKAEGACYAAIKYTVQIGLPVRHFGSNSAVGTDTNPYMAWSARVADRLNIPASFLNQFGGRLVNADTSISESDETYLYTLPWLGSAINSSYIGSNYLDFAATSDWRLEKTPNPGSYPVYDALENSSEADKSIWAYITGSFGQQNKVETRDELALCAGKDVCINKAQVEQVDNLQSYDPVKFANDFTEVNRCGGSVPVVKRDPQNYTYGTEMLIQEDIYSVHPNVLAYEAARGLRDAPGVGYNLNFTADQNTCECTLPSGVKVPFTSFNFFSRNCALQNTGQIVQNNCVEYTGGAESYETSNVIFESEFPDTAPQYKIEGVYDSLAALYNRVQTDLSRNNQKLIFNVPTGWEADVVVRAYQEMPTFEENFKISQPRENNYLRTFNHGTVPQVAGVSTGGSVLQANSCSVGINFATRAEQTSSEVINQAAGYGYKYGLMLTTGDDSQKGATSQALSNMCSAGMTPVLRSCFTGECLFSGGAQQAAYLNEVINASSCNQVYVQCGHNEPISENPAGMVNEGQWTAQCVAGLSGNSKALITTPTFNATHPTLEQNVSQFMQGYGNFNASDFACLALNTYENVGGQAVGDHYNRITGIPQFSGMSTCVMETGYYDSQPGEQDTKVNQVVSDLQAAGGSNLLFMLGFNWMGTNPDSAWANYILSEDANNAVANCTLVGDITSEAANYEIKGDYFTEYDDYLADGKNFHQEKHYYRMLGLIDELTRIYDTYAFEQGLPSSIVQATLNWPHCESGLVEDLKEAGKEVNCIANFVESPASPLYVQDPLGKFLCERGYDVVGENCNLRCEERPQLSPTETPQLKNPSCPIKNDICWQSPLGNATHYCSGGEPAFDLYNTANEVVYAPEDGQIVYAEGYEAYNCTQAGGNMSEESLIAINSVRTAGDPDAAVESIRNLNGDFSSLQSSGGVIGYLGDSGIYYRLRHVDIDASEAQAMSGGRFTGGQALTTSAGRNIELYHVPGEIYTPCWRGAHLHTWGKLNVPSGSSSGEVGVGQFINGFQLYGDLLGCGNANNCTVVNACAAPSDWIDLNTGGSSEGAGLVCTEISSEVEQGNGPTMGCNEFNCAPGNPQFGNFNASLECAANTLSNDVSAGKSLALVLDEYGPYCDNETRGVLGSGISRMPFAFNFMNFYNTYAPEGARCPAVVPPATPREQDIGLNCSNFDRATLRDASNPAWQYYRGDLVGCLSPSQMTWEAGTHGLTVTELASRMANEIRYNGISMRADGAGDAVPIRKIEAVLRAAQQRNLNPYLLVGVWATESWFGKSNPSCNVF